MAKDNSKQRAAIEFLGSMRGQYIVSQALTLAAKLLTGNVAEGVVAEASNAADMIYLRDHLFPVYPRVTKAIWNEKDVDPCHYCGSEEHDHGWCLQQGR